MTEIAAFGLMALCFAYWQFALLTATTLRSDLGGVGLIGSADAKKIASEARRQEQYAVLAVHPSG